MSGKIDIATLSKLSGHKNLKQTMKYAHLSPAHLTKAAHAMDQYLPSQLTHNWHGQPPQAKEKELSNVA